jgi:ketosteroid isomerase-like protein
MHEARHIIPLQHVAWQTVRLLVAIEDSIAVARSAYAAYADMDIAAIDALMTDDHVVHVAGHHPLSGEYRGKEAVWGYLGRVAEISGGRGGFEVHAITADDDGHAVALLTGTIRDFIRPVIHVWHVRDQGLAEMWDASLDQSAEDAFWTAAVAE